MELIIFGGLTLFFGVGFLIFGFDFSKSTIGHKGL